MTTAPHPQSLLVRYHIIQSVDSLLQGIAKGEVSFVIESAPEKGEKQPRRTHVKLPITLEIIPTPPRYVFKFRTRSHTHSRPSYTRHVFLAEWCPLAVSAENLGALLLAKAALSNTSHAAQSSHRTKGCKRT